MKIIICHPGTQYAPYLAVQLYRHGQLLSLNTGIAFGNNHILNKILRFLPQKIAGKIKARIINDLPDDKIKRNIFNEIYSLYRIQKGVDQEKVFYERNKKFQEKILNEELLRADIVIGYDTSSWIIARQCKDLGIPFILDVSIGHSISKNTIFKSLSLKYPDWKSKIQIKDKKLISLENQENELANLIVAPSSFVQNTLVENGVNKKKIKVNPFGTNTSYFTFDRKTPNEKIKFLFFGGLTARKGLPLLLTVWRKNRFKNAALTIAGFGELPEKFDLPDGVINKGKIALEDRKSLFQAHDVFIFPSNFEGFAQVQIEAAASGLPIISTVNAGGAEIIKNGFNGLLVTPESEKELEQAIDFLINNPDSVSVMSENQRQVINNFTWDAYGERWLKLIKNLNINEC